MSKKGKELAITTPSTPLFDQLQIVKEQLKNISKITDRKYKTIGVIAGFKNKVENETEIPELIKMLSVVIGREKAYNDAQERLSDILPSAPVFRVDGSTADEWQEDIRLRIQVLSQKESFDELEGIKKDLESLMDKEDKLALTKNRLARFIEKNGGDPTVVDQPGQPDEEATDADVVS